MLGYFRRLIKKTPWGLPIEQVTGCVGTTDTNHAQVHEGKAFTFDKLLTGLASGATNRTVLKVPAGVYPHLQNITAIADQTITLTVKRGAALADGIAPIVPVNRNDNSSNASAIDVNGHTFTPEKTLRTIQRPASIQGGTGSIAEGIEWVLRPGKSYEVSVTNNGAQAIGSGSLVVDWYEETAGGEA